MDRRMHATGFYVCADVLQVPAEPYGTSAHMPALSCASFKIAQVWKFQVPASVHMSRNFPLHMRRFATGLCQGPKVRQSPTSTCTQAPEYQI